MGNPSHLNRDFVGYGANPPDPQWKSGAALAVNFVINYEEGSEPSIPDGDAYSETGLTEGGSPGKGRDLAAESMFEYGSRVGFWRVDRLLAERGMTATIYGCALALERNPEVCARIRERGYDICAHGWRWEHHQDMPEDMERERIRRAVESIEKTIGRKPEGWYCRYGPGVNTRRLVVEHGGFLYDSDAYNDELPYWTAVHGKHHLVIPHGLVNNDTKFIRGAMLTGDDFFQYMKDAFDVLRREAHATHPKMMTVSLHLRLIGHPGRSVGLERFLDYIAGFPDVWVCQRQEIARHWWEKFHP